MLLSQQMSQESEDACAVGSNVVVLRDDLSRVQIAAVYGIIIRIFEPKAVTSTKTEHVDFFKHRWVEIHCLTVEKSVDAVLWSMNGKENFVAFLAKLVSPSMRLTLVMGNKLLFYQQRCLSRMSGLDTNPSASHTAENERAQRDHSWDVVWSTQLQHAPKYTRYSPDGAFLAVAGEYDHTVKIFYEEMKSNSFELAAEDYSEDVRGDDESKDEHFEHRSEVICNLQ